MKVKFRKHKTKNTDETEKSEFVGRGGGDHQARVRLHISSCCKAMEPKNTPCKLLK